MAYEKRLCVLKQLKKGFSADGSPLSGAVYAERMGSELLITPKLAGLSPLREGRYALSVWVGGKLYCLELKGNAGLRIPDAPSLKDGFSVLVCFVRGEAEPLAGGVCGNAPNDRELLLSVFEKKEGRKDQIPAPMPPKRDPDTISPRVSASIPIREVEEQDCFREGAYSKYDDEAIAAADYFGGVWKELENADAAPEDQGEEAAQKDGGSTCADEEDATVRPFRLSRGGLTYYREIEPRLKEAMKKYPHDTTLRMAFPYSDWVKTERALLGVIYAEGLPRFLCVAMKEAPPEEVKDECTFVPTSPYDEAEGYFVVFQDADTGEYVKVENA